MIEVKKEYYSNGNVRFERYKSNDLIHRENGPAIISWDKDGNITYKEYYLNIKRLTQQEWYDQISVENKLRFAFGLGND